MNIRQSNNEIYLKILLLDVIPNLFECLSTGNLSHAAEKRLHLRRHSPRFHYSPRLSLLRLRRRLRRRRNRSCAQREVIRCELDGDGRRLDKRRRLAHEESRKHTRRNRHFNFQQWNWNFEMTACGKKIRLQKRVAKGFRC